MKRERKTLSMKDLRKAVDVLNNQVIDIPRNRYAETYTKVISDIECDMECGEFNAFPDFEIVRIFHPDAIDLPLEAYEQAEKERKL